MVGIAIILGLLGEVAGRIVNKNRMLLSFNLQKRDTADEDLDQPVTMRKLMKMLKDIDKVDIIANVKASPKTALP